MGNEYVKKEEQNNKESLYMKKINNFLLEATFKSKEAMSAKMYSLVVLVAQELISVALLLKVLY